MIIFVVVLYFLYCIILYCIALHCIVLYWLVRRCLKQGRLDLGWLSDLLLQTTFDLVIPTF